MRVQEWIYEVMAKQKNIEVIAINLPAGEEELLSAAAQYFADRLLTSKQQKMITLLIDAANCPIRVPLSRDMLSERPGVFGVTLPTVFEMSVSTAAGIKDALEVVAHEIIHISQVLNRRLRMRARRKNSTKTGRMSYSVKWIGDKFSSLDDLPWHLRPWEIEACQWQVILVGEFIDRMTGTDTQIITQRGRNNQLALLNIRPATIKASPQSPSLLVTSAMAEQSVPMFESKHSFVTPAEKAKPHNFDNDQSMSAFDVQERENKPDIHPDIHPDIDQDSAAMAWEESTDSTDQISDNTLQNSDDETIQSPPSANKIVSGMMNGHQNGHQNDIQHGDVPQSQSGASHTASNDGENTAIQIRIDGLEAPRLLSRGALSSKLDDLLARGLIAPEDAKAVQTSLTSTGD